MAPSKEKSSLKRVRVCVSGFWPSIGDCLTGQKASQPEQEVDPKKPRRSQRISSQADQDPPGKDVPKTALKNSQLPSPLTHKETTIETEQISVRAKDGTVTPPEGRPSQINHRTPISSPPPAPTGLASPPQDTQPFSQAIPTPPGLSSQVQDEEGEGVWGYLIPLDHKFGDTLVLRDRSACPISNTKKASGKSRAKKTPDPRRYEKEEDSYEQTKIAGIPSGGYLIGRHPECGKFASEPVCFPWML